MITERMQELAGVPLNEASDQKVSKVLSAELKQTYKQYKSYMVKMEKIVSSYDGKTVFHKRYGAGEIVGSEIDFGSLHDMEIGDSVTFFVEFENGEEFDMEAHELTIEK